MRAIFTAAALVSGLALAGCDTLSGFDPLDKLQELDIMGSSKTPLKGERRAVFPEGVPGVPQGVPPDMVKGYQPPPEAPPPVVEAKPAKPKPKKTASAPAAPRKPRPQPQPQEQQAEQAPAPRTTTQPVNQSAGGTQTMPGAQPSWPTNAPPAPGPWSGPQR
jgi:outer membrane biosynthesis protein TonB